MRQIQHFVPDASSADSGVVPRLRWPVPTGVTQAYVEAYTEPGELVLVPYCQGPAAVQEILAAGRKALALNFDPAIALVIRAALTPLPARDLDAAVTRLADSPKHGMPLSRYLEGLYTSTCPACLRPVAASFFIWEREQDAPVAKHLCCPSCGWDGPTAIEPEDQARLREIPVKGMHYHYILDRVAPQSPSTRRDPFRPQLEQILELYSPRNLYALAELTMRIESLFPDAPPHQVLKALLLDCLDRCSSLAPFAGDRPRRRGLSRPSRYLERNVWQAFEAAVADLQTWAKRPASRLCDTALPRAVTPHVDCEAFVGQGLVRDLPRIVPPRSTPLILTSPPPLDSTAWSLSYFWGAWLLGAEAVTPLRPLLRQRTPDPSWYARVMSGPFGTLASLLCDEGRFVLILSQQRPDMVEALCLAASSARLGLASLVQCGADYRLELTPTFPQHQATPLPSDADRRRLGLPDIPLQDQIQQAAAEAAVETIRHRGEPTPWRTVHAAVQRRLAEVRLWARVLETSTESADTRMVLPQALSWLQAQVQAGLDGPGFVRLPGSEGGEELWWLAHPTDMAPPLCDRVEVEAHHVLQGSLTLAEFDFVQEVYARFPGDLTPDRGLVATCLRSFGREITPTPTQPTPTQGRMVGVGTGFWQIRAEDLPAARQAEREAIINHLRDLGQRLGYRPGLEDPFDLVWLEGDQLRAVFAIRWLAALHEALGMSERIMAEPTGQAKPYLVIPGGRAALLSYKLTHNPLWQQKVDEVGWRFIKYRHVRQLMAQPEVDDYALRTIIGLDPIVERESMQLSLF